MNEQNPTSAKINVEELLKKVSELENQKLDLEAKVHNLNNELDEFRRSYTYVAKENDKFRKALTGIKSLAEIMLP